MQRLFLIGLASLFGCSEQKPQALNSADRPKLIVVVTVDQMRDDFLDLYGAEFTGGFERLRHEGLRFENAWVEHAPTNSYPGHASIATGAYPRNHGFSDNSWKIPNAGEWQREYADDTLPHDCARDGSGSQGVGLYVPTIGERVIAAGGKLVSISASRNIARVYAGAARAPVLWLSPRDNGYTTNNCYMSALPDWAADFNQTELRIFVTDRWDVSLPSTVLDRLRPDNSSFEGEGRPSEFPHIAPEGEETVFEWFYDSPNADASALALALRAVKAEGLGSDHIPDVLHVVINTIDNTGHRYGPFSVEQTDNLFKLDRNLGQFMEELDRLVGKGAWAIALTGDHGAAPAPESLERHPTAKRISDEQAAEVISAAHNAAADFALDDPRRQNAAADAVRAFDFVDRVYTGDQLIASAQAGDPVATLHFNSYIRARPARHPLYDSEGRGLSEFDLTIVLQENVVMNWATSIHGSHYDYDRRVPIIFLGPGVENGRSSKYARTIDIAPTLLHWMNITNLKQIDGEILKLVVSTEE